MKRTSEPEDSHTRLSFPASRLFTMDVGVLGRARHHVKALVELDVTDARRKIRELKSRSGAEVSFSSWFLFCLGLAVAEHRGVHALRRGRTGLTVFEDVDISTVIEREVEGVPVPLPLVVRRADKKSIGEIYREIEKAKGQDIGGAEDFVLGQGGGISVKIFSLFPRFLRLIIWRAVLSSPLRVKRMMGTVMVTSPGTAGKVRGWAVPFSIHPLSLALGSIVEKPGAVRGDIAVREYLALTVLFDHDVIDGAPAVRFIARFTELVEDAHGL